MLGEPRTETLAQVHHPRACTPSESADAPAGGCSQSPRALSSSPWLLQGGHREESAGLFAAQHSGSLRGQRSPTEKGELLAVCKVGGKTPFRTGACSSWGSSGEEMRPAVVLYWGKGLFATRVQFSERSRAGNVGCFCGVSGAFSPSRPPRGVTVRAER